MKIRMLTAISGDEYSWAPGEVVDVDSKLGKALCSELEDGSRRAEPVTEKSSKHRERATAPARGESR